MKNFVLLVSVFLSFDVFAGSVISKVKLIQVNSDATISDIAVVTMEGQVVSSPQCAANDQRFVIDLTTDGGRASYSTLLASLAQNRHVKIAGTNSCNKVSYLESVQFIQAW